MKMRGKPPCAGDFPDRYSLADLRSAFQCWETAVRRAVFRLRSTTVTAFSPAMRSCATGGGGACGCGTVDF